ncbi:MAG TPA: calcium-binding protein [Nocardioides sp.]|nr:calcium-binding protein [Nocardioides sp.]
MTPRLGLAFLTTLALMVVTAAVPAPAQAAAARWYCHGHVATIKGTAGDDVLRGTARRDVIQAGPGEDVVNGLGGDDIICGAGGADDLRGQGGNDRLYGDGDTFAEGSQGQLHQIGDTLRGGPGADTLVPGLDPRSAGELERRIDAIAYDTAPGPVQVRLEDQLAVGDGRDRIVANGPVRIIGSRYDDFLLGSSRADTLLGGAGSDRLYGLGGDDRLETDDVTTTGTADDQAWGGAGNDRIESSLGDDRLTGDGGDDVLRDTGATSSDVLQGGPGDDFLNDRGTADEDSLAGDAGSDTLTVSLENLHTVVDGGEGVDGVLLLDTEKALTVDLATGTVQLAGTTATAQLLGIEYHRLWAGPTTVIGSPGPDRVAAGSSVFQMNGLGGDDEFMSGAGADTFDGGDGTDCYTPGPFDRDADTITNTENWDGEGVPGPCPEWPAGF